MYVVYRVLNLECLLDGFHAVMPGRFGGYFTYILTRRDINSHKGKDRGGLDLGI